MKRDVLRKYLQIIILALGIGVFFTRTVAAAEITAVDFNGNVIGQVISTGMVINADGENVGYITADSLIINDAGDIIGGVVPQGVAIGLDNRLLGKINSDGIVRSISGKPLGKALPNGLVIDTQYAVIGAVLFPGLVYSAEGNPIGRLTGAGTYTNLDGTEVGFISANGYAYRKSGNEYILDGRLMSSKMVVSLSGEFIGSIAPSGRMIDFEGHEAGTVRANGYVYGANNEIIGRIVQTGYAFNLAGQYIGVVTYNGTVVNGVNVVAFYRADGNIVNNKNEVIGFAVPMSATANDNSGRYLGRILPKGLVAGNVDVIGVVGAKGNIYDREHHKIGQITQTGPVFDTLGNLNGQSMSNGAYISLKGSSIGRMKGRLAFDSNGMLAGGLSKDMLAFGSGNKALGTVGIASDVADGAGRQKVSPFGYVMTAENKLIGSSYHPTPIYGLEGLPYSYLTPNGSLYREMSDAKMTMAGILIGKNGYIGSMFDAYYALGFKGQDLGTLTDNNIILNDKDENVYKVTPGGYVVETGGKLAQNVMPIRGFAGSDIVALATNGDLLGYADSQGNIIDLGGNQYGRVVYGNYVSDTNNSITGKLVSFTAVNNDKCAQIGVMNGRGEIVNNRDVVIGRLLPNGQAVSDVGTYIGYAAQSTGLVDFDGNYVGTLNQGKGLDFNDKNLGCANRHGIIVNNDNQWQYGAVISDPVIDFENNIIGQVLDNGSVADNSNQILGAMQPNGTVISKSKKVIGNVMRYKVAFTNNNTFLGMVQSSGQITDNKGETVGQINFDGSVQHKGEIIGYALYDWYVYNDNFALYGFILKDGTILSTGGSRLGKIDRGFVVDKTGQVVARGNRDYTIRDASRNAIGELQLDGNVLDYENKNVGYLAEGGIIRNTSGDEIATAYPLQYYIASEVKTEVTDAERRGWADMKKVQIQNDKIAGIETVGTSPTGSFNRRIVGIALNPDGDIIGNIYDDNKVYDDNGNHIGFRTPDGMIVDRKYNPIGVEEIKNASAKNMFVPAGTFGSGNAYGIGNKPSSLGPGGGYGQGERYDPAKASALSQLQNARRDGIQVKKVSSNVKVSNFTGYEDDDWPNSNRSISSWRVDMSEMILEDKPIPAVLARSVYASSGLGSNIPVTAIVERNIYSEEGRNIIIPAGSRVIGSLGGESGSSSGGNSGGAVKIGITWKRLIRPDGSQFTLGNAQTADAQGRAGAIGYLDEQLLKKYTAPLLMSAMESATAYMIAAGEGSSTTDSGTTTSDSKSEAASDARENFLEQMDEIFDDIISKKADIQSVTYVPAGTRVIIFPNQDMWLNSEKRSKQAAENSGGYDDGTGLLSEHPERTNGGGRSGGSNVTYNGEYDENISPTGGGLLDESGNNSSNQRRQQMRRAQQQINQQNNTPATIPQQSTTTSADEDVPSLL